MTAQLRYIERKMEEFINQKTVDGGALNRSAICEEFGFSVPSASQHIQKFMARNPGFLNYDATRKAYYRN